MVKTQKGLSRKKRSRERQTWQEHRQGFVRVAAGHVKTWGNLRSLALLAMVAHSVYDHKWKTSVTLLQRNKCGDWVMFVAWGGNEKKKSNCCFSVGAVLPLGTVWGIWECNLKKRSLILRKFWPWFWTHKGQIVGRYEPVSHTAKVWISCSSILKLSSLYTVHYGSGVAEWKALGQAVSHIKY